MGTGIGFIPKSPFSEERSLRHPKSPSEYTSMEQQIQECIAYNQRPEVIQRKKQLQEARRQYRQEYRRRYIEMVNNVLPSTPAKTTTNEF
jgi:hypothetical protein